MPYSQAAINLKNKTPERGQRILQRALIYPAASPGQGSCFRETERRDSAPRLLPPAGRA
jgi:hypothetical protein